ncbi:hypothetical protein [Nocardia sp. NPDC004123]
MNHHLPGHIPNFVGFSAITTGSPFGSAVTGASTQHRDGARPALRQLRELFDTISLIWADSAYIGALVDWAKSVLALTIQIVKRSDDITGFV